MTEPGCQHPGAPVPARTAGAARRQEATGLRAQAREAQEAAQLRHGAPGGGPPAGSRTGTAGARAAGRPAVSLSFLCIHPDPFPPSDRRAVGALHQVYRHNTARS